MRNLTEENLQSFHLSSVSKDPTTVDSVPKKPQRSCSNSHPYCIVDEESTTEETPALQKLKTKCYFQTVEIKTDRRLYQSIGIL